MVVLPRNTLNQDNKGLAQKGSHLFLLLVLSNLLLCQGVVSCPVCPNVPGDCQVSLRDLFDRAVMVSHYIHNLSSEMFNEILKKVCPGQRVHYHGPQQLPHLLPSYPLGQRTSPTDPPLSPYELDSRLLRSWNDPLYHLVTEVRGMKGAPDAILSRAIEIEEQNRRLLEGMEMIFGQVIPGAKETEPYPVWSGLPSLQTKEKMHVILLLQPASLPLRRDSNKIVTYLKLLNCRIIYNNNC
uniref:Prolactin n=1 Tax=Canis lupus familiaris TaxID=9615 RepID=Q5S825_CANLF|nr:prolactin [Canis lupus familiaris]